MGFSHVSSPDILATTACLFPLPEVLMYLCIISCTEKKPGEFVWYTKDINKNNELVKIKRDLLSENNILSYPLSENITDFKTSWLQSDLVIESIKTMYYLCFENLSPNIIRH